MLFSLLSELPIGLEQTGVLSLEVVLETALAREGAAAEDALERLEAHVHTLRVVLQVRDRLEGLATVGVGAPVWPDAALDVGEHVAFQVLLLLEGLLAARRCAGEPATVALEMPVQFAPADELLVHADGALELQFLAQKVRARGCRLSDCRGTQEQSRLGLVMVLLRSYLLHRILKSFFPAVRKPLTRGR